MTTKPDVPLRAPSGKTAYFRKGWAARMNGEKGSNNKKRPRIIYDCVGTEMKTNRYWQSLKRVQEWDTGYLSASRALGRERRRVLAEQETKRLNAEHDEISELSRELAL